ncbi:MAG: XRE family transcriptional regulator [Candidatus Cloacimonadales bacterium]
MIGGRIKDIRKVRKIKQIELAERLNLKASALSQMESNKIKPSIDTMNKLCALYGINLHWLITGKGSMMIEGSNVKEIDNLEKVLDSHILKVIEAKKRFFDDSMITIPISGEISAGIPIESKEQDYGDVKFSRDQIHGRAENYLCLKVNGSSMEPVIKNGDVILIEKSSDWERSNGKICAIRLDGEVTLKKMKLDKIEGKLLLIPLNDGFETITVDPQAHADCSLIGIMTFLYRKFE